jgi:hypothetical protein
VFYWLLLGTFTANLPFGFLRVGTRRFSLPWLLCIHAPIPLVILTRLSLGIGWSAVPFLLLASLAGQIAGGKMRVRHVPGG